MPHGLRHAHLADLPLDKAKAYVEESLSIFEDNLIGFKRSEAIFNFPFNQSSPQLEEWLAQQVRAFRTGMLLFCR